MCVYMCVECVSQSHPVSCDNVPSCLAAIVLLANPELHSCGIVGGWGV